MQLPESEADHQLRDEEALEIGLSGEMSATLTELTCRNLLLNTSKGKLREHKLWCEGVSR